MPNFLILDDHAILGEGLRSLLWSMPDTKTVKYCQTYQDAQGLVETQGYVPCMVLLDIALGEQHTGFDFCKWVKLKCPATKVVFISMYCDHVMVGKAMNAGADGYVSKNIHTAELLKAIENVMLGESFLSEEVQQVLLKQKKYQVSQPSSQFVITDREKQILELITRGFSTAETASQLSLSPKTIEFHRANLFVKFDAKNVAELTRLALQFGTLI